MSSAKYYCTGKATGDDTQDKSIINSSTTTTKLYHKWLPTRLNPEDIVTSKRFLETAQLEKMTT
jgi:hypothetical protein